MAVELHPHLAENCRTLKFSKEDAGRRDSFLRSCKPGAVLTIQIKRYYPEKSYQQVKTIFGLLVEKIKEGLDERGLDLATLFPTCQVGPGIPCPREVILQVLYATCNDVGPQGERKTLSQMDTVEAAAFFEKCRDYVASTWGIVIPDPDPNWRQKLAVSCE